MIRAILILLCLTLPAAAQTQLPARYDVTGVTMADVLNIRAEPNAHAPILGGLAPTATGIEVVRLNETGRWGQINTGERAAWVSMRFMARQPGQTDGEFPALPLRCFGAEPFFSVDFPEEGFLTFSAIDTEEIAYDVNAYLTPVNDRQAHSVIAVGESGPVVAVLRRRLCSDGMSDRLYGIGLDFLPRTFGATQHLSGCCTLQ